MLYYESLERELRLRGCQYNTIKNYSSCLKTIVSKIGENPSLDKMKDFLLTIKNRSYHKQMVATLRHYFNLVLHNPISPSPLTQIKL